MSAIQNIGLPAARVLAESTRHERWTIITVEEPRRRTVLNRGRRVVRLSFPWVAFVSMYNFDEDKLEWLDLYAFGSQDEPTLDSPLRYLILPHCNGGEVCLGSAQRRIWYEGLAPEQAFWNSDFAEGAIDPDWPILGPLVGCNLRQFLQA